MGETAGVHVVPGAHTPKSESRAAARVTSLFALTRHASTAPAALPAQLPDWGAVLAGSRAAEPARDGLATGGGPASGGRGRSSAPAKKESARAKTVRERAARSKAAKAADTEEEVDEGDEEEMDEGEVLKSMGKGPFTAEEIRRQRRCAGGGEGGKHEGNNAFRPIAPPPPSRAVCSHASASHPRMLSNRESARRSRRRKLEHVHTLQGQIDVLRAEGAAVAAKLREAEQRADAAARENRGLKAEVERLHSIAARAAADGCGGSLLGSGEPVKRIASLPRIASAEHIAKRMREAAAGEGAGNESPRGFVPFRSIRSFENLAGLGVTGSAGQQHTAVAASGGGL